MLVKQVTEISCMHCIVQSFLRALSDSSLFTHSLHLTLFPSSVFFISKNRPSVMTEIPGERVILAVPLVVREGNN